MTGSRDADITMLVQTVTLPVGVYLEAPGARLHQALCAGKQPETRVNAEWIADRASNIPDWRQKKATTFGEKGNFPLKGRQIPALETTKSSLGRENQRACSVEKSFLLFS
jgi:hypothetical protein